MEEIRVGGWGKGEESIVFLYRHRVLSFTSSQHSLLGVSAYRPLRGDLPYHQLDWKGNTQNDQLRVS